MKIALGNSRFAKKWSNKDITYQDLCARCVTPIRTSETVVEYAKMGKAARDDAKDKGGYVMGHLRGGRRKSSNVESRSALTLDVDYANAGTLARVQHQAIVYSTHSHTQDAPRYRIILPLARDVSADEYSCVARLVAHEIGMDAFDDSTYEPSRLMYWPSCPQDGEYVFEVRDGGVVDPDAYLATLSDWRDCTLWPMSSRQSAALAHFVSTQADPLGKAGIVGTFCRTYRVEDVIETFLSDVYTPCTSDRYTYAPGTTASGLVVYGDGRWAYSHHGTDPACGKLLNAFDLVRVHRFPDLDEIKSYSKMAELAIADERVKRVIQEEKRKEAERDFTDDPDAWMKHLTYDKQGNLLPSLRNALLILENDVPLRSIRYNQLANTIELGEGIPWEHPGPFWRDADTAQLICYVDQAFGSITSGTLWTALTKVVDDRSYHPVRDMLDGLPAWDGVGRLDTILVDYLGAEDTPYTRAVTRKTLVAMVARVRRPGVKFDHILVLIGTQGIGKSYLCNRIAGMWYSDSLSISDMRDKTAPEKLQGYWLLELSELAGLKKMDVETVKSFASRQDDKYRPSYGRVVENHPRQNVIVGTTNSEDGFLRDVTGNRRFWPIRVTGESVKHPWDMTDTDVEQVWAEALVRYDGEELYLTGGLAEYAAAEQVKALEHDDREGLVASYLETLLPEGWDGMDQYRRQEYYRSPDDPTRPAGVTQRTQVSNIEVWCECFGRQRDAIKKADSYEIEAILKSIGSWKRYAGTANGMRNTSCYGRQRVYIKE